MKKWSQRMLKNKVKSESKGSPEWMTTYGDLVTLLLCFFILLYSYSVIDIHKFQQIISSIQVTFLGESGIMETSTDPSSGEQVELNVDHKFEDVLVTYQTVKEYLKEEGLEHVVSIRIEERGVILEIQDRVLFDSAKDVIRPEAEELLEKVGAILAKLPNQVIVEGHTDNVPINTFLFPSNWELSVARAVRVVRYLSERKGIGPERFIATGYGEYQPVATNLTSQGRSKNRRVNIVICALNLLDKEVPDE